MSSADLESFFNTFFRAVQETDPWKAGAIIFIGLMAWIATKTAKAGTTAVVTPVARRARNWWSPPKPEPSCDFTKDVLAELANATKIDSCNSSVETFSYRVFNTGTTHTIGNTVRNPQRSAEDLTYLFQGKDVDLVREAQLTAYDRIVEQQKEDKRKQVLKDKEARQTT